MKRLIAPVLCLSLLPGFVSAEEIAEEAPVVHTDYRYDMMTALGIINNYEDIEEYFDIPYVSREEFCVAIASLITDDIPASGNACPFIDIGDSAYKNAITYLYDMNIVSGVSGEEFHPELAITIEEATILAVRTLGYDFYAENFENETYRSVASKYGFLKGMGGDLSKAMDKTAFLTFLENVIDIEPFGVEMSNQAGKPIYGTHNEGTILELYRSIYTDEGIMTENAYTGELSVKTNESDTLVVNDVFYDDDSAQDKSDFLGMYVTVYYELEDGDRTALYIIPDDKKNNELTIEAKDLTEGITSEAVTYEYGNKTKKAKLSRALKVFYNGAAYTDYTLDELIPEYGTLRLVDNNNDGIYEYAFVTSYDIIWLDRYSALEKKLYNRFKTAMDEVTVKDPDVERNLYIEKDGEVTDRFGVSTKDVLLITESKNEGDKIVKIYASSKTVDGTLTSNKVNEYGEREFTVDGEVYLLNPLTEKAMKAEDSGLINIEIGNAYRFYLDVNGKIAAFDESTENTLKYGYMKKMYSDEEERFYCKVFTEDGLWKEYRFAEKVRYNDESVKDEFLYDDLAPAGITSAQMIRYKLSGGDIKRIDTAVVSDKYRKDKFTTSGLQEFMYVWSTQNLGDRYFFNSGAKIFVIPTDKGAADDDYQIRTSGMLETESKRYSMEVYDEDDFGHSSIFKLEQSVSQMKTNNTTNSYSIVRSTGHMVDEDDVIRSTVECSASGEEKVVYYGYDATTFDGLKLGDVIKISKNLQGYVIGYTLVCSVDNVGSITDAGEPDMYNASIDIRGYVEDVDASRGVMKMRINDKGTVYVKNSNANPNVTLVDGSKLRSGTMNDIKAGDFVAVRMTYGYIADVVIYRD